MAKPFNMRFNFDVTFACETANGIGKEFGEAYVLGYSGYKRLAWVVYAHEEVFV